MAGLAQERENVTFGGGGHYRVVTAHVSQPPFHEMAHSTPADQTSGKLNIRGKNFDC